MVIISEGTQFESITIEVREEHQPQTNWRFWCLLTLFLTCLFCGLFAASVYYTMQTKTEPSINPQNFVSSTPTNIENVRSTMEDCHDADCIKNWLGETATTIKSIAN